MNNRIKNARNDGDGVKGAEKKEDHTWHKDDQLQHVTSEVACFNRLVIVMPLKCQTCSIPHVNSTESTVNGKSRAEEMREGPTGPKKKTKSAF